VDVPHPPRGQGHDREVADPHDGQGEDGVGEGGKVSAPAKVTFAPSGGAPGTESRKLLLKKSRRNGVDDRDRPRR
jgi:hypothetical protein